MRGKLAANLSSLLARANRSRGEPMLAPSEPRAPDFRAQPFHFVQSDQPLPPITNYGTPAPREIGRVSATVVFATPIASAINRLRRFEATAARFNTRANSRRVS